MERSNLVYAGEITDEELQRLSVHSFEGTIVLVESIGQFMEILPELRKERVFGFDTETRPAFKKGQINKVALLQLSTNMKAYLFRLNKLGLPEELAAVLSDNRIIKAGVAIHDDIKALQKRRQFTPGGFIELQTIAANNGIKNIGLKKLAAIILGFKISKKQQVTDWEAKTLSGPQLVYAATDAWICHEIYREMLLNGTVNTIKQKETK